MATVLPAGAPPPPPPPPKKCFSNAKHRFCAFGVFLIRMEGLPNPKYVGSAVQQNVARGKTAAAWITYFSQALLSSAFYSFNVEIYWELWYQSTKKGVSLQVCQVERVRYFGFYGFCGKDTSLTNLRVRRWCGAQCNRASLKIWNILELELDVTGCDNISCSTDVTSHHSFSLLWLF